MKANQFKGSARKGARKVNYNVRLKKVASDANEKIEMTKEKERTFNKSNKPTLGEMVYRCINTSGYFAFMRKYAKKNDSAFI